MKKEEEGGRRKGGRERGREGSPEMFPLGLITNASRRPRPRTRSTRSESMDASSFLRICPRRSAFSESFSSTKTVVEKEKKRKKIRQEEKTLRVKKRGLPSRAVMATLQARGFPPNVDPCCPGFRVSMTSSEARTADTGYTPPERAFPRIKMSGFMLS